jgi:two-component system, OmpR family, phosphate regulon response regulator OmpR
MSRHHLLVVDDDRRLRELLVQFLKEKDFKVSAAANAAEARVILTSQGADLIILDIMMPSESGLEFTQSLKNKNGPAIPILFLTAKDSLEDKIIGLDYGGDDYMTKPFEPEELLARIRAILRRSSSPTPLESSEEIRLGDFSFNLAMGTMEHKGNQIFLSSTEIVLLKTLAQSPRTPFSREELAQRIGHRVSERSVDVQITRLRRKIADDSRQPRYIQTVRHIGYALCPD